MWQLAVSPLVYQTSIPTGVRIVNNAIPSRSIGLPLEPRINKLDRLMTLAAKSPGKSIAKFN
jgi:hypothetical protein